MTQAQFDIFDCHHHVGGVFGVPGFGFTDLDSPAALKSDSDIRVEVMDRCGVRQALLMPGHSYVKVDGMSATRGVNDRLAAYQRLNPERFPVVIGVAEPRHGLHSIAEIERMHFELGFQGVSWHHRQQGLPMDHPVMVACLRRMEELNMVPLIHCYVGADFEELWRLRRLAEQFPGLPFLCLDTMTHPAQLDEALAICEQVPNVLLDTTSSILGPDAIRKCAERIGADRLLFGTNLYSQQSPPRLEELGLVMDSGLPPDMIGQIVGANARRLFGLDVQATS